VVARALELGLFIRPLGAVLYLWPPLNAPLAVLRAMLERLERAAEDTAPGGAPTTRAAPSQG
jgi:adenosylmethionine-8-amino-7-oxononanoate aminotransferase